MNDWSSYALEDLLMFSATTYFRMFELHNATWWPAFLVGAAGLGVAMFYHRFSLMLVALGIIWGFVGYAFVSHQYGPIFPYAEYLAWGFGWQAAVFVLLAFEQNMLEWQFEEGFRTTLGIGTLLFSLYLNPLLFLFSERSFTSIELFAVAPDPTVLATSALLLLLGGTGRWLLMPVALVWSVFSLLTLWALGIYALVFAPALSLGCIGVALVPVGGTRAPTCSGNPNVDRRPPPPPT
ncbi:MAG: DUF6064 family protein, partial [Pseudomonadota bacterium]